MVRFEELSSLADQIDSLGLHREADMLDKILEKQAQVLSYKEKPFLARLAKVMLVLRKYKPGEAIKEDLIFPITNTRLYGMTPQQAMNESQKILKVFIDQFLLPNFDKKYKGTKYEIEYRKFIDEVHSLYQTLQGAFPGKTEQQNIREALLTIDQTKRALGRLIVFVRTQQEVQEINEGREEEKAILEGGLYALDVLGAALRQRDFNGVRAALKEIREAFPRKVSDTNPLFRVVNTAFEQGELSGFVSGKDIERETQDRLDLETNIELEQVEDQFSKLQEDFKRKTSLARMVDNLKRRAEMLKKEIIQHEFDLAPTAKAKPFLDAIRQQPGTYVVPTSHEHYRGNKYRKYEVVEAALSNLETWLERYRQVPDLSQVIPFSIYLSKGANRKMAVEATDIIYRDVMDLTQDLERDINFIDNSKDVVNREYQKLQYEKTRVQSFVIWDMWHQQFIVRLIQTINFTLTPEVEDEGKETSSQAFNKVLSDFNKVLNYPL